jgi:hypothetical protein
MFDVMMNLVVRINAHNEPSGDEGEFQIAAVTAPGGRVEVEIHQVPLSQVPRPTTSSLFATTDRAELNLPVATVSDDEPYFAYAVRAIEFDSSNDDMRRGDRERLAESIRDAAQLVFDGGGRPTVNTIWLAGNDPQLADRASRGLVGIFTPWWWRDDDDLIGVSARVYPDLGTILENLPPARRPGNAISGSRQWTELHFGREDASWSMAASVSGRRPF